MGNVQGSYQESKGKMKMGIPSGAALEECSATKSHHLHLVQGDQAEHGASKDQTLSVSKKAPEVMRQNKLQGRTWQFGLNFKVM